WLKLTIAARGVNAWVSENGSDWDHVGSGADVFHEGNDVRAGYFVASAASAVRFAAADFAEVQIRSLRLATSVATPVQLPQAIPLEGVVSSHPDEATNSSVSFYADGIQLGVSTQPP